MTALAVCSFFLDANLSYWELKALDIPPSHIQYFLGRKSNDQGFCVTGDCQVRHLPESGF